MQNYAGTVVHVLNSQFSNHVVPASDEETGKAQLTRAAVYEISLENPNIGHYQKLSGNQVHGLSVDAIVDRVTGSLVDIATSQPDSPGFVRILPGWYEYPLNPADAQKWVQATATLAALPGPMPKTATAPGPGPSPQPPAATDDETQPKLDLIIELLESLRNQEAANTARVIANDDANTEKIQSQIHNLVEDFEASAKKVLAIWLSQRDQLPPDIDGEPPPAGGGDNQVLLLLLKAYLENRP